MSIKGNKCLEEIYEMYDDMDTRICEFLDSLYPNPSLFNDSPEIELLEDDEHFFITCCSAIIIYHLKNKDFDSIPKWAFDERLILKEFYVFGRIYRDREENFVRLFLDSPSEFLSKNVIFDPYSLIRY